MRKAILVGVVAVASLFLALHVFRSIILSKILYYGLLCSVLPLVHIGFSRGRWRENFKKIGFKLPLIGRAFVWTSFLCILLWGLVLLAYLLFARYLPEKKELWELVEDFGMSRRSLYLAGIYVVVINPFLEEFFWRGYVQNFLMNGCSSWLRVLIPSIFFGGIHVFPLLLILSPVSSLILSGGIGCVGALWAFSRLNSDSLLPALLSHSVGADLMLVYLAWRFLF